VDEPATLDGIASSMLRLGALTGAAGAAEAAATYRAAIARLRDRYASRAEVRVFYQVWPQPLLTLNGRHLVSDVLALCGGRNVFADLDALVPPVSTEAVLAADPQVIVTTDDTIADPVALWRQWPRLRAVQAGTVYSLSSDLVTRASPRLAEGVEVTCRALDRAREVYRRRAPPR
ncbi:MAG TPA: ABC transporter substrate-binding protein, partial [Steroidobacteraceae bacterium]|nr:ABC transporter substrate-binding protein [Steroidobacteraceae bacterium]